METMVASLRFLLLLIPILGFGLEVRATKCISYLEQDSSYDDDLEGYTLNSEADFEEVKEDKIKVTAFERDCPPDYKFCFSLWQATTAGTEIVKQGCWKDMSMQSLCKQSQCISTHSASHNKSLHYCCCMGNSCNGHFQPLEIALPNLAEKTAPTTSNQQLDTKKEFQINYLLLLILILAMATVFGLLSYLYKHRAQLETIPKDPIQQLSEQGYTSNSRNVDNINLLCIIGNGKYGTVMKGRLHNQDVAVKIYSEEHYQYFVNERNIYSLPYMDTTSFLKYLGCDEHITMEGRKEYLLILSLASLGNLQDWLISSTFDIDTFTKMAKSITNGLSHLHTEFRTTNSYKPSVVHRDFTSRNVLVKPDLTCCIADFGFALKVFGSKYECKGETFTAEVKSISEVGTLRYMAPELLEGAVNLKDCETSLKQMDVYALGLVIWEVATRCTNFYSSFDQIPLYKAPYQLEVGLQPTFDQMQNMVARNKIRPSFPEGWGVGSIAKVIKETCEDCWDHDPDARLTSICVNERMRDLMSLKAKTQNQSNPKANNQETTSYQDFDSIQRPAFLKNKTSQRYTEGSAGDQENESNTFENKEKSPILQNKNSSNQPKYDTISSCDSNPDENYIQIVDGPRSKRPTNLQIKNFKVPIEQMLAAPKDFFTQTPLDNQHDNPDMIRKNKKRDQNNTPRARSFIESSTLFQSQNTFNGSNFNMDRNKEKFLEIFVGKSNYQHLRNPSQRVKTPGDVPPSVRKVRASKTLSLYDDRMMQSSNFHNV